MVLRRILGVARLARRTEEIGLRRSHDDVAAAAAIGGGRDSRTGRPTGMGLLIAALGDKKTTTGDRGLLGRTL